MRTCVKLTMILLVFLGTSVFAERIDLGKGNDQVSVSVQQSDNIRTVLHFETGAFEKTPVDINGQRYFLLSSAGENVTLNEGEPALPRICRSIIIPDDARMQINVLESEYVDFPNTPVAPSKGDLLRTVNPDDVPYTFGQVYSENAWYPANLADIREPFILRDYRGTVVEINAFQYNPATQTLRVYTSVTVEIVNDGPVTIILDSKNKDF